MKKPDWGAIRREYETDGVSARKLAEKYGISHTAINHRAKAENWQKPEKKTPEKKVSTKKISTEKVERKKVETRKPETGKSPSEADERVTGSVKPGKEKDDDSFSFDLNEFGLSEKESKFVLHFLKTGNRAEAYRAAGYGGQGNTVYVEASRMYRKPKISKAIRYLKERFRKRYTADIDELVDQLIAIIRADPNDIAFYRRVNCRYCWGENHLYQWRDIAEFDKAAEAASKEGKESPEYGGLGFVDVMDPNPDCPRCYGEGKGQMHINDTRDHEGPEKHLFAGVKLGKFGIEILTEDKKAARQLLAQLITKFDLGSNSENVPRSLNDYYADIRKTKPESGAQGILGDAGEE
ncbi:TPA: terminase small subunit [Klebsiella oxytoca]